MEKASNPGVVNVVGKLLARYHIKVAVFEGINDPLGFKEVNTVADNFLIFCGGTLNQFFITSYAKISTN